MPSDRHPEAGAAETDDAVFARLLTARHSCRAFTSDPVPRVTIEAILATAQKTASWNNTQPWQVIVTGGAATERFRALMVAAAQAGEPVQSDLPFPREYRGVYLDRRRACGFQLYDAVGVQRGDRQAYARQSLRNYQLFDAPHVAIVTSDEALGPYGAVDCGAYVTNFMTAAQSLGVATIAQAALAVHADKIRAHFSISPDRQVVCGISFGFADQAAPANQYRTTRAGLGEVVQWLED
ncbi:MAG: nitroreductase family protein [Rhizobiales bacterium]|nr:nitroreductase family protein [Hyphomicrobiales bacterium]